MLLVAAPDKFRGSATAAEVAAAAAAGARRATWRCDEIPMSDGGEGLLAVLGGANRSTTVTGPLGTPVDAGWRLDGTTAVIESAEACGLARAGGRESNDPLGATTTGVGELLTAALDAGARRIVVGLGGTATTDGGLGCVRAGPPRARFSGVDLVVACDVDTHFVDAAAVFAGQKGATPTQVAFLTRRLEALVQTYRDTTGIDVSAIAGGGAAGGLGGALATTGARLVSGIDAVAETLDLDDRLDAATAVMTGEGYLDEQSFAGKVVGGVLERATAAGRAALVIVGDRDPGVGVPDGAHLVVLSELYGLERAMSDTVSLVADEVARFVMSIRVTK